MTKDRLKESPDWLLPGNAENPKQKPFKPHFLKPRLPTEQEKKEVIDYLMSKDKAAVREHVEAFFNGSLPMPMAVFDHYETNGFEYEGKLFVTISDYDPTITQAYIWRNGKVEAVNKLHQQIERKEKAWITHLAKISR